MKWKLTNEHAKIFHNHHTIIIVTLQALIVFKSRRHINDLIFAEVYSYFYLPTHSAKLQTLLRVKRRMGSTRTSKVYKTRSAKMILDQHREST